LRKGETWIGYIIWVAFLVASISLVLSQAYPYLLNLQKKNEIEKGVIFLERLLNDAKLLSFTGYGSEFSYSLNFNDAYIVVYENKSIIQLRFKTEAFPFRAEDFKTKNVNAYFDYDQLVLETVLPKKFLLTFSDRAKGIFYLRNKVEGFVLTNKRGSFLDLNFSYKPSNEYLSWDYNFVFNYYNPWEDIWLVIKDLNNNFPPKEFYFFDFENLSNLTINFNLNNESYLVNLELNLFTDFGNYWNENLKLEIPYNSRVNVTFVFDNVKSASLNLSFNYLNKNWSINCSISGCKPSILYFDKELIPVEAKVIRTSTGYNFSFFNLPTYTNYSIDYSYDGTSGNTWRVFTSFILACNDTGTGLSCSSEYWTTSGLSIYSKDNNFYLNGKYVNTICRVNTKQCGIDDYEKKSYLFENNMIKVSKDLLSS